MTNDEYRERVDRVNRLVHSPDLHAAFGRMRTFPDGSGWSAALGLCSALDYVLYNAPDRNTDACKALRAAVAEVEARMQPTPKWWNAEHTDAEYTAMAEALKGHPVWDLRKSDLTEEEQKLAASRWVEADGPIWTHTNLRLEESASARHVFAALKALRNTDNIEGYKTVHARLCTAVTDVLENRWPVKQAEPPQPVVHTCQMSKLEIRGDTASQGPCGKPVHASAPNAAGFWYCEECVSNLMVSKNTEYEWRKKREVKQLKRDLDRPFKPRYMIGTGDLHGPKLL